MRSFFTSLTEEKNILILSSTEVKNVIEPESKQPVDSVYSEQLNLCRLGALTQRELPRQQTASTETARLLNK